MFGSADHLQAAAEHSATIATLTKADPAVPKPIQLAGFALGQAADLMETAYVGHERPILQANRLIDSSTRYIQESAAALTRTTVATCPT